MLYVSKNKNDYNTFQSIEDAINNAKEYDKIIISSGIYKENITITKNIHLIGESRDNTILENDISKDTLFITEGCTIENLQIISSKSYIPLHVYACSDILINNCIITSCYTSCSLNGVIDFTFNNMPRS